MYSIDETYFIKQLNSLMDIDSVTGMYRNIQNYVTDELTRLGFKCSESRKGAPVCSLGGNGNPLLITAHLDEIGLTVRHINDDGTLQVRMIGGAYPYSTINENVRIYTFDNKVYTGSVQRHPSSVHILTEEERLSALDYGKNVCVLLDENVRNADDVRKLGIDIGCIIALEPRTCICGDFIKSRFLDDKAAAAMLLCAAKTVKELKPDFKREVIAHFGVYEEEGHGCSYIPDNVADILSVDIAPTGPLQNSDEHKVSVLCQDCLMRYHYEMTQELINTAKEEGINYVTDIFDPGYSTDSTCAVKSGYDIRYGAICFGVSNSHGYERIHMDGIRACYSLMMAYMLK